MNVTNFKPDNVADKNLTTPIENSPIINSPNNSSALSAIKNSGSAIEGGDLSNKNIKHENLFDATKRLVYEVVQTIFFSEGKEITLDQKVEDKQLLYSNIGSKAEILKDLNVEKKMITLSVRDNPKISALDMLEYVKKGEELFEKINNSIENLKAESPDEVKCLMWYLTAVSAQDSNVSLDGGNVMRFSDPHGKINTFMQHAPGTYVRGAEHFKNRLESSILVKDVPVASKSHTQSWGLTVDGLPGGKKAITFDKIEGGTTFVRGLDRGPLTFGNIFATFFGLIASLFKTDLSRTDQMPKEALSKFNAAATINKEHVENILNHFIPHHDEPRLVAGRKARRDNMITTFNHFPDIHEELTQRLRDRLVMNESKDLNGLYTYLINEANNNSIVMSKLVVLFSEIELTMPNNKLTFNGLKNDREFLELRERQLADKDLQILQGSPIGNEVFLTHLLYIPAAA